MSYCFCTSIVCTNPYLNKQICLWLKSSFIAEALVRLFSLTLEKKLFHFFNVEYLSVIELQS